MNSRHLLLCTSLLAAAALSAQTPVEPGSNPPTAGRTLLHRPAGPLLRTLDGNADGVIAAGELRVAGISLTGFDLNEDGALQREEIAPGAGLRVRHPGPQVTHSSMAPRMTVEAALMLALDANHDGVLQPLEMANASSSLRRFDANGDGAVTLEEIRAGAIRSRGLYASL